MSLVTVEDFVTRSQRLQTRASRESKSRVEICEKMQSNVSSERLPVLEISSPNSLPW
jgi:hypothetical protein